MEKLLCRRLELFHSSGKSADQMQPAERRHVRTCTKCRERVNLDTRIAHSLRQPLKKLPAATRRRIQAFVAIQATPNAVRIHPFGLIKGLGWAAVVVLATVSLLGPALRGGSESMDITRAEEPVASFASVLPLLEARHRVGEAAPIPRAVLTEMRLPTELARPIVSGVGVQTVGVQTVGWSLSPPTRRGQTDATLFVMDRDAVTLDEGVRSVLNDSGAFVFEHRRHFIQLSLRDSRLFVVIATGEVADALAGLSL